MPTIFLVSHQSSLVEQLSPIVDSCMHIKYFQTLSAVEEATSASSKVIHDLVLILVHVEHPIGTFNQTTLQRYLRAIPWVPVIAILDKIELRQMVWDAGISDYLLFPLIPTEVRARLKPYIESMFSVQEFLLEAFSQLNGGYTINDILQKQLPKFAKMCEASVYIYSWNKQNDTFSLVANVLYPSTSSFSRHDFVPNNVLYQIKDLVDEISWYFASSNGSKIAYIGIPLRYQQQIVGTLILVYDDQHTITSPPAQLVTDFSQALGVFLKTARLYAPTLALMVEREKLHQQTIQNERFVTVGRLAATMAHEINNPMQAIQGVMSLALEELDDPEALTEYIHLGLQEAGRVIRLVNRMKQIYRPQSGQPEMIDITLLLQDTMSMARKELQRQQVVLRSELADALPPIQAVSNQLHLVFLNLMLNLVDAIGAQGGGDLWLRSYATSQTVYVELMVDASILPVMYWQHLLTSSEMPAEVGFDLSFSRDIISHHDGKLTLVQENQQTIFRVELSLALVK